MLAYKHTVRVDRRSPALLHIESCARDTQRELGYPEVLVVTEIYRPEGDTPTRHDTAEAEDLRTKGPRPNDMATLERKQRFARVLRRKLGSRFTVLLEFIGEDREHIHAQVKKGHVYP